MFKIFLNSVNDNELERELVYYRIYLDGKLLTFTKDKYPFLEEDMTDIPYAKMYYDSENRHSGAAAAHTCPPHSICAKQDSRR